MSVTTSMHVSRDERALLRALTHRTHNEFVSSIGIVSVAAVRSENPDVKVALSHVVDLLEQHAEIHRALAVPERCGLVDAAECIRKIGLAVSRALEPNGVRLSLAADTLPLESERSWRLALAVHELVTNAARHACFDGRDGAIKIQLSLKDGVVNCIVADNGSLPARLKPARGLKMVETLARSLGGRIEYGFGAQFSSFLVVFPLTERERRANRAVALRRGKAVPPKQAVPPLSRPQASRVRPDRARNPADVDPTATAPHRREMENA